MSPIQKTGRLQGFRETGMSKRGVTRKRPSSGRTTGSVKAEGKDKGKGKGKSMGKSKGKGKCEGKGKCKCKCKGEGSW